MVLVHELVHLLERGHNKRFYGFMDQFLPDWREADELLKRMMLVPYVID
jgi:predicted metal-dependent hydrolase